MVIKTWGLVPTSSGTRCVRLELRAEAGIMFRVSGVSHQAMMAAQARIRSALLSMETGVLHLHRADGSSAWSSSPWIVAATNPCPCGMGQDHGCVCASQDIRSHRRKLSQPLLDRFPIQLEVLGDDAPCERPWEDVLDWVRAARTQRPNLSWGSGAQSKLHACNSTWAKSRRVAKHLKQLSEAHAFWRGVPKVGAKDVDSASEVMWLSQGGWWRTLT